MSEEPVIEEEDEEDVQEEGDNEEECSLTQELISEGLSLLCHTADGLAHAFVRLELKDRKLTDIAAISAFVHLRYLDLSSNRLSDLSVLASLIQLLWLKLEVNLLKNLEEQPFSQMVYLQWLSVAQNKIETTEGFGAPALEFLSLTGNSIHRGSELEGNQLANLVKLELRGNYLESTEGLYLPYLRILYLADNKIRCLKGLHFMERLATLHLRDNQLDTLEDLNPGMKALQYLNIRGNRISSLHNLKVSALPTLLVLVIAGNPLTDQENYRLHVLAQLPQLERIDKDNITADERTEARKSKEIDKPEYEET